MIETTGLADPGPIAQTFFLDPEIAADYRPDAILTLVDAKHAMGQLDTRGEARRQVGFADRLFISKADLVSDEAARGSVRPAAADEPPRRRRAWWPSATSRWRRCSTCGGFNLTPDLELEPPCIVRRRPRSRSRTPSASPSPRRRREELRLPLREAVPRGALRPVHERHRRAAMARHCCATRACSTWPARTAR